MNWKSFTGRATLVALAALAPSACGGDSESSSNSAGPGSSSTGQGGAGAGGPGAGAGTGSAGAPTGGSGGSGGIPAGAYDCTDPTGEIPAMKLTVIAQVNEPIQVKSAPDDPDRVFIVQKHGEILIYENGAVLPQPFLDISSLVVDSGEEGLLGLAFHPNYASNGRFFVHYSAQGSQDSTIYEYKRMGNDPHTADPTPVQLVLQHPTAQSNHNGGAVEFGSDGFLYITMGDGGAQGDPGCDAMNEDNLLGKISRLDVDAAAAADGYPAAAGNPSGHKWFHWGMRNPWRITFDACTGDLYIGDVGQNTYEEVNAVKKGADSTNFGWPVREGLHPYDGYDGSCTPSSGFVDPIAEYDHGQGCSVSGGYVYRGSAIPGLRGTYFYGDYCAGTIWTIQYNGGSPTPAVEQPSISQGVNISAFGQDGHGEMYVADVEGGSVYKIEAM